MRHLINYTWILTLLTQCLQDPAVFEHLQPDNDQGNWEEDTSTYFVLRERVLYQEVYHQGYCGGVGLELNKYLLATLSGSVPPGLLRRNGVRIK